MNFVESLTDNFLQSFNLLLVVPDYRLEVKKALSRATRAIERVDTVLPEILSCDYAVTSDVWKLLPQKLSHNVKALEIRNPLNYYSVITDFFSDDSELLPQINKFEFVTVQVLEGALLEKTSNTRIKAGESLLVNPDKTRHFLNLSSKTLVSLTFSDVHKELPLNKCNYEIK